MQILLQQISTRAFLTPEGTWTENPAEARDFEHFIEALHYARNNLSVAVAAYCVFSDPAYNFRVEFRQFSGTDSALFRENKAT